MLELGGAAGHYSLNAEYAILQKERYQLNARAGGFVLGGYYNALVGINNTFKMHNSHLLEIGGALSYIPYMSYAGDLREEALYFSPSFGYRYDDLVSGLVFRFAWTPLFPVVDLINQKKVDELLALGFPKESIPYAKSRIGYVGLTMGYRFGVSSNPEMKVPQEASFSNNDQQIHPWAILFELGGAAFGFSMIVEYALLSKENYNLNVRTGGFVLSWFRSGVGGVNLMYTLHKSHHLEVGSSFSYVSGIGSVATMGVKIKDEAIYYSPSLGYRYDALETGLFFRFFWSPLFPVYDLVDENKFDLYFEDENKNDVPFARIYIKHIGFGMGYRF